MADPVQTFTRTKFAAANLSFEVDVSQLAVAAWEANAFVAANELRRPSVATESADGLDHSTGYIYQNGATAGQSGKTEPGWPTTGTVKDGSCTFTPVAPPGGGENTISSAAWTQQSPPDGSLTVTSQTFNQLVASADIGGGTAGSVYTILIAVTMTSGVIYVVKLILTILP